MNGQTIAGAKVVISVDTSGFSAATQRIQRAMQPIQQAAQRMSAAVTLPLALIGKNAIDAAVKMDGLQRGLAAVAGGSAQAATQLKRLREVAKLPGLGLEEAIQGSINLQAAGFSAQTAERALRGFGNALATVGKGRAELDGVITALSQIASKGQVSAEEINQIAERVPQIRQIMKDAFGTASTEALQKMGLSATEFVERIITELEKLPKVTGGIGNTLENARDSWNEAMTSIGMSMVPVIESITKHLVPAVEAATRAWSGLSEKTRTGVIIFAGIAAAIGPVAMALTAILSPIGLVIAGIAGLAAVSAIIYDNWAGLPDFMKRVWNGAATIVLTAADRMLAAIEAVTGFLVDGPISRAARAARGQLQEMMKGLGPTVWDWAGDSFRKVMGMTADTFDKVAGDIENRVVKTMDRVADKLKPGGAGSGKDKRGRDIDMSAFRPEDTYAPRVLDYRDMGYKTLPTKPVDTTQLMGGALYSQDMESYWEGIRENIDYVNKQITEANVQTAYWGETLREMGKGALMDVAEVGGRLFEDMTKGANSFGDALRNVVDGLRNVLASLVATIAKAMIFAGLMSIFFPGQFALAGGFGGVVSKTVLGGYRANGGPVWAGSSFLVGEKEPEIFTPNVSGRITPISHMFSGNDTVIEHRISGDDLVFLIRRRLKVEKYRGYSGQL